MKGIAAEALLDIICVAASEIAELPLLVNSPHTAKEVGLTSEYTLEGSSSKSVIILLGVT